MSVIVHAAVVADAHIVLRTHTVLFALTRVVLSAPFQWPCAHERTAAREQNCLAWIFESTVLSLIIAITYAFTIASTLVCDALPDVGTKRTRTVSLRLYLSLCLRRRLTEARARAESATFRV